MKIENGVLISVSKEDIDENGNFIVPDVVYKIEEYAFRDLTNLRNVKLNENVSILGNGAFINCCNLKKIDFPSSVKEIDKYAFSGCTSIEDLYLPDTIEFIGGNAFSSCSSLTNVRLPKSINSISNGLFNRCEKLSDIKIPENITSIGSYAFMGCPNLKNVELPSGLKEIKQSAFEYCSKLAKIQLPDSIEFIDKNAFAYCKALTSIKIPENVKKIENETFYECLTLEKVSLPKNLKSIGESAFFGSQLLSKIDIPDSVEEISENAFKQCTNLTEVHLPKNLKTIGNDAFSYCTELLEIKIPDGVTEIRNKAFFCCDNLFNVEISDSVEIIGENAFDGCSQLTNVKLPKSILYISSGLFRNCHSLKNIDIPANVEKIGNSAFENCRLTSVSLPSNLKIIGPSAFKSNINLSDIKLPESLEILDDECFRDCKNLSSLNFPSKVYKIGGHSLEGTGLLAVEIPNNVTELGTYIFKDCENLKKVKFPENLEKIPSGTFFRCISLDNPELPKNLKTLGTYSFGNCTSLKNINLPESLITIDEGTFSNCTSLDKIYIPEKVKNVEARTFDNCKNIKSIHFPNSVRQLGYQRFDLNFFEKNEDGFTLLSEPTNSTIPTSEIKISIPLVSRNWDYHQLLFREQSNSNVCNFYNEYLVYQSDERIRSFIESHNFKFFKQLSIPNNPVNIKEMYNFLYNIGVTMAPVEINGKKVDYAQKIVGFLLEKENKKVATLYDLKSYFLKMNNDGFKPEYLEFFIKYFDEILEISKDNHDFMARCFNEFEEVQKTNTNNHGSQRQLKATPEKFSSYFNENKFSGVNESNQIIADTISPFFDEQKYFDIALKIENERKTKKSPNNILSTPLSEKSIFENIDAISNKIEKIQREILGNLIKDSGNEFSFDWLQKNDPQNLILGKLCSCCAHVGGVGYGIMHASIVDPYVQNLVIRNNNGEIVAKSTLYINPNERYGVFNNVEVNSEVTPEQREVIYKKYILGIRAFAEQYNRENPGRPLKQINVGMHLNDLSNQIYKNNKESNKILKAMDYSTYGIKDQNYSGDSDEEQYVVWQNESDNKQMGQ